MKHTTIITPQKSWALVFKEWWEYREVLMLLGWRDVILQYRQTAVGVLWVLIRPLLTVAVFTLVFHKIAGFSSGDAQYALVVLSGMLAWQFFADTFSYGSGSFLGNVNLISKVYFPRIMLPASRLLCSAIDLAVVFCAYLTIAIFRYGVIPSLSVLVLPLFFVWLTVLSLSVAVFLGSLVVRFRDFKHVIPFLVQIGFYCTPVAFSLSMIPQKYHILLACNPLTGIITGFRYTLLGEPLSIEVLSTSLLVTLLLVGCALAYYKKAERLFADFI